MADLDALLRDRHAADPGDASVPADVLQQLKALAEGARAIRAEHAVPAEPGSLTDDQLRQELGLVLERDVVDRLMAMMQRTAEFADPSPAVLDSARAFFAAKLQKQSLGAATSFGFLEAADFELLIAELPPIPAGLAPDDELAARRAADEAMRAKRAKLTMAFLPFLQRRLIRRLAANLVTASQSGADPALVEDLLTDPLVLGTEAPLIGVLERVDDPLDASGPLIDGYLEVPATGVYRFTSVVGRKDGHTTLTFAHLPQPVLLDAVAAAAGDEFTATVVLQAGRPYAFTYRTTNLGEGSARLDVQSEMLPRGPVSQVRLYPANVMTAASRALALVGKVLGLVRDLALTSAEIRYLAMHPARFGYLRLSELPTSRVGDTDAETAATRARFTWTDSLIGYAGLKRDLGGGGELLTILEGNESAEPERLTTKVYPVIAGLTGVSAGTVAATADQLWARPGGGHDDVDLGDQHAIRRLIGGLRIVSSLGVPADVVRGWTAIIRETVQDERAALAAEVKDAIRATLQPAAWQQIAQPVFDRLRARQRDALVAYVQAQLGFSTMEQLYEYFLLDPGMEPVVQTSRIRLASSSVQLFIQRILLNLEPSVPPEVIDAEQWEWMRRYRVWEANRKIFLYPENWLEPEFRDQKTHLFSELESTLLEGDVSSDLVEDAFLTYLTKLERLARLDVVASHLEDDPDPANRTLHVFGRTFGTPHSYFYRRYAHGAWTPWEPVALDIQGDHLAPVVWHDRLRLFWVTFAFAGADAGTTPAEPTKAFTFTPAVQHTTAQLHWSEYAGGTWSNPHSGNPLTDQSLRTGAQVTPSTVSISVAKEAFTDDGKEQGLFITLGSPYGKSFYVQGRNSPPVSGDASAKRASAYSAANVSATQRIGYGPLTVRVERRVTEIGLTTTTTPQASTVLRLPGLHTLLEPNNDLLGTPAAIAGLINPFFVQDGQYTLFAEPEVSERTVREWEEWVTIPAPPGDVGHLPGVLDELVLVPSRPYLVDPTILERPSFVPHPPEHPDWLLNDVTGVLFDEAIVHPAAGTSLVGLDPGLTGDSGVLGRDTGAGVLSDSGGFGVVGGSGVSRGVLANVTASRQLTQLSIATVSGRS